MIMQLLAGANLINIDFSLKEDRAPFSGAQKCMSSPSFFLWASRGGLLSLSFIFAGAESIAGALALFSLAHFLSSLLFDPADT
jgi:hypothetical protein